MKGSNPPCPCGSELRYSECCRPFHRGEEAPDPVRLMRSRFSAYALGEVDHLLRTLHPEHEDRQRDEAEVRAELRAARRMYRYVRLRVLDHDLEDSGGRGRVLFHAEIYESGKDRSFLELSTFVRTAEGWRYHSGSNRPLRASDPGIDALRIPTAGV